jgi:hypothetical protein
MICLGVSRNANASHSGSAVRPRQRRGCDSLSSQSRSVHIGRVPTSGVLHGPYVLSMNLSADTRSQQPCRHSLLSGNADGCFHSQAQQARPFPTSEAWAACDPGCGWWPPPWILASFILSFAQRCNPRWLTLPIHGSAISPLLPPACRVRRVVCSPASLDRSMNVEPPNHPTTSPARQSRQRSSADHGDRAE